MAVKTQYSIATLPGDGIGLEVLPAGTQVIDFLGGLHGFQCNWKLYDWGCKRFLKDGLMMPSNALELIADDDAIFLGAVGAPDVPDHVSLWGMLIPIRRTFQQYINQRPARIMKGVPSPLKDERANNFDIVVIRENNEGEYSSIGGRLHTGTAYEMAVQESVFTRRGVERVMDYSFNLANTRKKKLTSATKSNGIIHTMPFWDEIFEERKELFPQIGTNQYHIDALVAMFILDPSRFDVVVASNLFGDILTDLSAAAAGSIGIAPSANINPEREFPSMFEPVHGSAPDISGKGIANPIGQIWSGAMMLEHLGEKKAAEHLMHSMEAVLASDVKTPDLGGKFSTEDVTAALIDKIKSDAGTFTQDARGKK